MLDDNIVMTPVRPVIPSDVHGSHRVSLARVSTYVYRTEVGKSTTDEVIAFPTFASHWVIVVTEPDRNRDGLGYHLTFRNVEDARRSSTSQPGSKGVKFTSYVLETIPDEVKEVGRTRFSHSQLMDIGRAMIRGFGSYHRVFWNCQHFARLYLSVITDGKANFDEWTSAQAANLFLCAFVVTSPVAKTNKMIESRRRRETLDNVGFRNGQVDEDAILRASDEAIDLAQELARADYERNEARSESVNKGWSIVETIRRNSDS